MRVAKSTRSQKGPGTAHVLISTWGRPFVRQIRGSEGDICLILFVRFLFWLYPHLYIWSPEACTSNLQWESYLPSPSVCCYVGLRLVSIFRLRPPMSGRARCITQAKVLAKGKQKSWQHLHMTRPGIEPGRPEASQCFWQPSIWCSIVGAVSGQSAVLRLVPFSRPVVILDSYWLNRGSRAANRCFWSAEIQQNQGEEPDVVCLLCGDASHVRKLNWQRWSTTVPL